MIGYNMVKGLDWPVMWKGDPALFRLYSVWMRALTSGHGLDTTARNLKLCVSTQMCDLPNGQLATQLLFVDYTSGSTLELRVPPPGIHAPHLQRQPLAA